jgi:hypothetical protein
MWGFVSPLQLQVLMEDDSCTFVSTTGPPPPIVGEIEEHMGTWGTH